MNKLIVLIGVSCSGKTTWAKEYLKRNTKTYYVSRDQERESIFGNYRQGSKKEENTTTKVVKHKTVSLLNIGDVILDNTHLKLSYLPTEKEYPNMSIEYKVFDLPDKEVLLQRNKIRNLLTGKSIPIEVLNKQIENYKSLKVPENIIKKGNKKIDPRLTTKRYNDTVDEDLPYCVISDLDGTLALINDRSPFDGGSCENDILNYPVSNILDTLSNEYPIILFSGRNSDKGGREATEKWLKNKGVYYDKLIMREPGDQRSDTIIKKEMFNKYITGKYKVLTIFDDRDAVVDMWRDMGLDCFQVYYGNF